MSSKKQSLYEEFFKFMKTTWNLEIKSLKADYEIAIQKAFSRVYTGTDFNGCLFHYGQVRFKSFYCLQFKIIFFKGCTKEVYQIVWERCFKGKKIFGHSEINHDSAVLTFS